jgi:hypothetical protein
MPFSRNALITGFTSSPCLAPSFGTYLRCESVSEKFIPEIGAILTPEKRDQLVREFGFTAPGYSKNFSQKIEVTLRANCKLQSGVRKNAVRTRLPPWRRSADRTRLHTHSLQTGNFTGKFAISRRQAVTLTH